jgi:hypothetical protein
MPQIVIEATDGAHGVTRPTFTDQNNFNSRPPQYLQTSSAMFRIRIDHADGHALDSRGDNAICAGRRAAARGTRFQSDIERCAIHQMTAFLRIADGFNFRMGFPCPRVPAAADDFAALHENRTDHRIRRRCAVAAPGEPEGEAHELGVRHCAHRSR